MLRQQELRYHHEEGSGNDTDNEEEVTEVTNQSKKVEKPRAMTKMPYHAPVSYARTPNITDTSGTCVDE